MPNAKNEQARPKRALDHDPAKLRRLRFAAGLTLTELSGRSGVDLGSLSRYENGKRNPSPRSLARLAEAIGCEPIDLMPDVEKAVA